jgi:hypothetical protein
MFKRGNAKLCNNVLPVLKHKTKDQWQRILDVHAGNGGAAFSVLDIYLVPFATV